MLDHAPDLPLALELPADLAALDVRLDLVDRYRRAAVAAMRDRHDLNARMVAIFDQGSGTIAEFGALSDAHEIATNRLGEALIALGHLSSSAGIA